MSGLVLLFYIVLAIATTYKISFMGAVAILAAILFGLYLVHRIIKFILGVVCSIASWREQIKPCSHGVKAGRAGACDRCKDEREHQVQIERLLNAERQKLIETKREIKRQAQILHEQELARLSQSWLSNAQSYYSMSSQRFEDAIAELFRKLGYEVKQTPYSNDGGKDAILFKDGNKYLVECKRYSESNCIGRPDIQKFVAAMQDEAAIGGFYVNTGRFSSQAREYAQQHAIRVFDRFTFPALVIEAYPVAIEATFGKSMCLECGERVELALQDVAIQGICPNGHQVTNTIKRSDLKVSSLRVITGGTPHCAKCGSPMRVIKGFRGDFLGCQRYPKCKYTRNIHKAPAPQDAAAFR